jgi:hypothetical protein
VKAKKMKRTNVLYTFTLYILLSFPNAFCQIQFELSLAGAFNDATWSIIQTNDGGYAAAGNTYQADRDMYIIKLDANGIIEWSRIIGGLYDDQAYEIIQTNDGGYAVAGFTYPFGQGSDEDMYIVKLDSSGTFQWHKSIGGFDFGERNRDFAYSIIQTSEGGYALAGYTWRPVIGNYLRVYIVKLDENGDFQWSRVFGGSGVSIARSIIQTTDGGFAIAGYTRISNRDNFYIVKLDENGNIQWNTSVGGLHDERAYSIIQTSDGGYVATGETLSFSFGGAYQNMYIVKLDSTGSIQWTRVVGGTWRDIAYDIIQTSDGDYVIAGYTISFGSQSRPNVYIVKLNPNGTLQWSKSIGGNLSDIALSITNTIDGGFAVAGYTYSYTTVPSTPNIYIVKFDSSGNTCANTSSPPSQYSTGGTSVSPTLTYFFPVTFIHEPAPLITSGGVASFICTFIPVELTSFTSSVNGNNVTLSWVTASEINNSGFEIEKQVGSGQSAVGNWEKIGFVEGNGTTTETNYYSFEDKNLSAGKYSYRLKQIDFDGTFEYSDIIEVEIDIPVEFSLSQNYPNPFNPLTTIEYQIPADGFVSLTIYNTIGQEVSNLVNEYRSAGNYSITLSADELSSGLYFYTLRSGEFEATRKMILLK